MLRTGNARIYGGESAIAIVQVDADAVTANLIVPSGYEDIRVAILVIVANAHGTATLGKEPAVGLPCEGPSSVLIDVEHGVASCGVLHGHDVGIAVHIEVGHKGYAHGRFGRGNTVDAVVKVIGGNSADGACQRIIEYAAGLAHAVDFAEYVAQHDFGLC